MKSKRGKGYQDKQAQEKKQLIKKETPKEYNDRIDKETSEGKHGE